MNFIISKSFSQTDAAIEQATLAHGIAIKAITQRNELAKALRDCINGYRYIEQSHGRLYGVGWNRIYGYESLL